MGKEDAPAAGSAKQAAKAAPPPFAPPPAPGKPLPPSFGAGAPPPPSFGGPGGDGGGFGSAELAAKAKAAAKAAAASAVGQGPKGGMEMPPPPKPQQKPSAQAAPPPPSHLAQAAAAAAMAAARAAPAQRERAVQEAAMAAIAAHQEDKADKGTVDKAGGKPEQDAPPRVAPGPYEAPEWDGPPGHPYTLEILKDGQILKTYDLQEKGHHTFGRGQGCDILLEHPSASRLHAVVQFSADTGEAFVMDCGSTHGTFVNKRKVKPQVYAPLQVGSVLKFGSSTRMYILGGPADLMPEEGLSRSERHQLRALEEHATERDRLQQIERARAAAARGAGASWGLSEDAEDADSDGEPQAEVDWRDYKGSFTEKQQKTLDKIRKKEQKLMNLKKENDNIHAKEGGQGGLTAGQAATAARNDQRITTITDEMEDLEEVLNESLRESLGAKRKKKDPKKKKRGFEEEDDGALSDDDDFYDRAGGKTRGRGAKAAEKTEVETVDSLWGRKKALLEERKDVAERLREEQASRRATGGGAGAGGGGAGGAGGDGGEGEAVHVDPLDAFMSGVAKEVESEKGNSLQRELDDLDEQVARVDRLLQVADPTGFYRPTEEKVAKAKAKVARQLAEAKAKVAAEDRKRREEAATAAALAAEAEEDEEEEEGGAGGVAPSLPPGASDGLAGARPGLEVRKAPPPEAKPPAAAAAAKKGPAMMPPPPAAPESRKRKAEDTGPDEDGFMSREALRAAGGRVVKGPARPPETVAAGLQAAAADKVAADLALLSKSRGGITADEGAKGEGAGGEAGGEEGSDWVPPEGQSGDGRTKLNDLLGY